MTDKPSRTWKPTTVYRAYLLAGRILVDSSPVQSWGSTHAVLSLRMRAWNNAMRVPVTQCFQSPEEAYDDVLGAMRDSARATAEDATRRNDEWKAAELARADVITAAKAPGTTPG